MASSSRYQVGDSGGSIRYYYYFKGIILVDMAIKFIENGLKKKTKHKHIIILSYLDRTRDSK